MDAGHENLDLEVRDVDTYPLLMDHNSNNEHVVDVRPGFSAAGLGDSEHSSLDHISTSQMSIQDHDMGTLGRSQNGVSAASTSSSSRSNRAGTSYNLSRQRLSPLNSGLWISIEFTITVSQIVASIIVLSLSRDEKPQAPLNVWVAGYAAGCLATLPLLYWRYMHRHGPRNREQESSLQSTPSPSSPPASPRNNNYVALSMPAVPLGEENHDTSSSRDTDNQDSRSDNSRFGRIVEKFKIALDCYFAVWFVVGNVWIFGGHSSSSEAPNLYRLCIVFLTFSCIGYAMPFILCATICCCLPCIIAVLGFHEEQANGRGASAETISALPTYKFKARVLKEKKVEKDESDGESSNDGGFVAAGTEKERVVSGEDAVCCICLAKYTDEVELRELPCTHHFHVECVDKWLKINASCPLCKHDIGGSTDRNMAGTDLAEDQRSEQSH